jgi:hypothetical protein
VDPLATYGLDERAVAALIEINSAIAAAAYAAKDAGCFAIQQQMSGKFDSLLVDYFSDGREVAPLSDVFADFLVQHG